MTEHLYLAYGSNMDPDRIRSRLGSHFLNEDAVPEAIAVLTAHKVVFQKRLMSGCGAADIVDRSQEEATPAAEAVIWRVSDFGLALLDRYEGVGAGHYRRELRTVRTTTGRDIDVAIYLAEPEVIDPGLRPERLYLHYLINGARRFLSLDYLRWLQKVETKEGSHA